MRTLAAIVMELGAGALLAGCATTSTGVPGALSQTQTFVAQGRGYPHRTASSYRVLYRFQKYPDGDEPIAGLIDVKGTLYGTAFGGGSTVCNRHSSTGCGTIYAVNRRGAEKLVFDFVRVAGTNPAGPLLDVRGTLYGTAVSGSWSQRGTIYGIRSGSVNVLHTFYGKGGPKDGIYPHGHIVNVNGTLYGVTAAGGGNCDGGCGVVYSVSTATADSEKVLYRFQGGSDGQGPNGLIKVGDKLYGTTASGGILACGGRYKEYSCGTVFSVTTGGSEKVLYRFAGGTDGADPRGDLLYLNGTFYGTTAAGGAANEGTVYTLTASGEERVLYNFAGGSDGAEPLSGLIEVNGTLYGTTSKGGGSGCGGAGCGTVYSISPTGTERVLYSFAGGSDGSDPHAPLLSVRRRLYGTTESGGLGNVSGCCGTVFALKP